MRIALQETRRWLGLGALTVTAAAALVASPPASGAITPPPAASWHGRPIRQMEPPRRAPVTQTTTVAPLARLGDGYGVPAGSPRVRAIQRTLLRLGYRCGPVDGMYGPLTRASVEWFQIKHGFPPTGVVDRQTLSYLQARTTAPPPTATAPVPHPQPAQPAARSAPAAAAAPVAHGHHSALLPILIAAIGVIALALLAALFLRRHPAPVPRIALPLPRAVPPAPAREPTPPLGHALTVGYAAGRDKRELDRQATVIGRACAERGWKLAGLVREGVTGEPQAGRPGLKHAIGQLAERTPSRLVVERLDHVARSPAELATVLTWCRRHGVDLAALDVGLDTGTPQGRLTARSLLAAGEARRRR